MGITIGLLTSQAFESMHLAAPESLTKEKYNESSTQMDELFAVVTFW